MKVTNLHPAQIMTLTVSSTLGIAILTIQHDLVVIANQDAWISMLLGGILAILMSLLTSYNLVKMFPKHDLPQIPILLFGKVFGRVVLLVFIILGLGGAGISLRIFVTTVKTFLLDRTPFVVLVLLVAAGVISVAKRGAKVIVGSIDFMFPVFMIPLILLLILPYSRMETRHLKPILFENTINTVKGALPAFTSLIGYGIITYFHRYISDIKGIFRWFMAAMGISTILYISLTAVTIMVFGAEEIKTMVYPTLILSKSIEFPVTLLERLETLVIIIWIPGFFAWLLLYTYSSVRNISEFFSIKPKYQKYVVYAHLPLLCIIAVIPKSGIQADALNSIYEFLGLIVGLGIIPALTIIGYIKKRRRAGK